MAIGDEENDRSMLEVAGCPVVMENGKTELKKIAKHITKSNAKSGVAHAINEWVLKRLPSLISKFISIIVFSSTLKGYNKIIERYHKISDR